MNTPWRANHNEWFETQRLNMIDGPPGFQKDDGFFLKPIKFGVRCPTHEVDWFPPYFWAPAKKTTWRQPNSNQTLRRFFFKTNHNATKKIWRQPSADSKIRHKPNANQKVWRGFEKLNHKPQDRFGASQMNPNIFSWPGVPLAKRSSYFLTVLSGNSRRRFGSR